MQSPARPHTDLSRGTARLLHLALGTALAALACKPAPTHTPVPASPPPKPTPAAPDPCADIPAPTEFTAARARVAVLLRCGDGPRALAVYLDAVQRDPRPHWAWLLATLALAEGSPDLARIALQALDRDGPARPVGLALLAIAAYQQRGDPAELAAAREHFQAALARAPEDPHALAVALRHAMAVPGGARERLVLAEEVICRRRLATSRPRTRDPVPEDSLAAAPQDDPATHGAAMLASVCARIALLSEEPGEARRRFALALALDPSDSDTRLRWAAAELAAGSDRAAADLYAVAAAEAPAARDRYTAALGLGVARTRLHDRRGAEAAYRAAATARGLEPGDPPETIPRELQFNLGTLLAESDDPAARAEAKTLLRAYLTDPTADQPRRLRCQQLLIELGDPPR